MKAGYIWKRIEINKIKSKSLLQLIHDARNEGQRINIHKVLIQTAGKQLDSDKGMYINTNLYKAKIVKIKEQSTRGRLGLAGKIN